MICPNCRRDTSTVMETRLARGHGQPEDKSYGIRRRRYCTSCNHRWSTVEVTAELFIHLVNVLESVRGLVISVTEVPDKTLLDLSDLYDDTRLLRSKTLAKQDQEP